MHNGGTAKATIIGLTAAVVAAMLLAVTPAQATRPQDPTPAPTAPAPTAPGSLANDIYLAAGGADTRTAAATYPRWPGSTITVRNTLTGVKRRAANRAIRDWNTAGLAVRFKQVKGSAQVVIRESRTMPCAGAAGCATAGYPGRGRTAYVWLAPSNDPDDGMFGAAWYARLVAHELGHILGLGHSGNPDALMAPAVSINGGKMNDVGRCRLRTKEDVQRAKRIYGGKGSLAMKTNCRFKPKVGAVPSVRVAAANGMVQVTWGAAPRAGSYTVRRGPSSGQCPANPRAGIDILASGRSATDDDVREGDRYCYRVFPANREGFFNLKGAKSHVFTAVTPKPTVPTSIRLQRNDTGLFDGQIGFDVTGISASDDIRYVISIGSQCAASRDDYMSLYIDPAGPDIVLYAEDGPAQCVTFWRVNHGVDWTERWSAPHNVPIGVP